MRYVPALASIFLFIVSAAFSFPSLAQDCVKSSNFDAPSGVLNLEIAMQPAQTTETEDGNTSEGKCYSDFRAHIDLGFYGRLASTDISGTMEINRGTAGVDLRGGVTTPGAQADWFPWFEIEGESHVTNGPLVSYETTSTTCGKSFDFTLDDIRAYVKLDYHPPSYKAQADVNNVKLRFIPVDPSDPACINTAMSVANNVRYQIRNASTNKCVDVPGGTKTHWASLQQWECYDKEPHQHWVAEQLDGAMRFRNISSGWCLIVGGGSDLNGAATVQGDCSSPAARIVLIPGTLPDAYFLKQENSEMVLDLEGGKPDNGKILQQWERVGTDWQQWYFFQN